uniref:Uncharacterized protein n=1 Tax=Romanomermis culicivorax TaxID=13658 RepID=A0A915JVW4_ROMCU
MVRQEKTLAGETERGPTRVAKRKDVYRHLNASLIYKSDKLWPKTFVLKSKPNIFFQVEKQPTT